MSEHDQTTRPNGRQISVKVFGDTADEIVLAALDKARAFFGTDLHLEVVPDYAVHEVYPGGMLACEADGKKYVSTVTVRTVE